MVYCNSKYSKRNIDCTICCVKKDYSFGANFWANMRAAYSSGITKGLVDDDMILWVSVFGLIVCFDKAHEQGNETHAANKHKHGNNHFASVG